MDKEIKMKLLEELMDEMDGSIVGRLKPKDEVQVTEIEQKEMPLEDVKEMIAEKMSGADVEDEGEEKYLASKKIGEEIEDEDELDLDDDVEDEEEEEIEEGDIPYQGGRLAEKLKALRKARG